MTESSREHCECHHWEHLLAGDLSAQQEARLTEHLAVCGACRVNLEAFLGPADIWKQLSVGLRRSEHLLSNESLGGPDDQGPASFQETSAFAAEFAIHFLKPSDMEGSLGRIDDIEISEVVGRGGMGIVLRGYQDELQRQVAVKVLSPTLAMSGAARQRFAREARAAAAVVHPNVMAIHAVRSDGPLPYFVMPFLQGETLDQRIRRQGALEPVEVLRIGRQIASALAAAHVQGVIHRDVKPANILLEQGIDRAVLSDFD